MHSNHMSVALARRLAGGEVHSNHASLAMPAARTIVHLAEQTERLQAVVRSVDANLGNGLIDTLTRGGGLLPGDMESPA